MASQTAPAPTNERILRALEEVKAQLADSKRRDEQSPATRHDCSKSSSAGPRDAASSQGWLGGGAGAPSGHASAGLAAPPTFPRWS